MGESRSVDEISTSCDPIVTNADLGLAKSVNGMNLVGDQPANPCGLVAKSVFNDTYQFYNQMPTNDISYTVGQIEID